MWPQKSETMHSLLMCVVKIAEIWTEKWRKLLEKARKKSENSRTKNRKKGKLNSSEKKAKPQF